MIPSAIKDLLASEKGLAGGILVIAATVFVVLNRMTIDQWQAFVTWVFGIYAAGKTATGIAATLTGSSIPSSDPAPPPSAPTPGKDA